jgi:hypothetical protein
MVHRLTVFLQKELAGPTMASVISIHSKEGPMRVVAADIPDVLLLEHDVHRDARGFFYEAYNEQVFASRVADVRFVLVNHSWSV